MLQALNSQSHRCPTRSMLSDLLSYAIALNSCAMCVHLGLKSTPWYCVALMPLETSLLPLSIVSTAPHLRSSHRATYSSSTSAGK